MDHWYTLWKAIVGDDFVDIPAMGSLVYYLPNIHLLQARGNVQIWSPPLLCEVKSVELLARPSYEVYAHFNLTAAAANEGDQHEVADQGGYVHFSMDPVPTFRKVLTQTDRTSGHCSLLKQTTDALFSPPHNPVVGYFMREHHPVQFNYGNQRLMAGGAHYQDRVYFKDGDSLIFTRINSVLAIGLRRAAPYRVDLVSIQQAILTHSLGPDFNFDPSLCY